MGWKYKSHFRKEDKGRKGMSAGDGGREEDGDGLEAVIKAHTVREGDANSRYFHLIANKRKRSNLILGVLVGN